MENFLSTATSVFLHVTNILAQTKYSYFCKIGTLIPT